MGQPSFSSSQQILAFCPIVQVLSLQIVPFSKQFVLLYAAKLNNVASSDNEFDSESWGKLKPVLYFVQECVKITEGGMP